MELSGLFIEKVALALSVVQYLILKIVGKFDIITDICLHFLIDVLETLDAELFVKEICFATLHFVTESVMPQAQMNLLQCGSFLI
jgi:hypothetical protein